LKTKNNLLSLIFILFSCITFAQTAKITGVVVDVNENPVQGVTVSYQNNSTITTKEGFYVIEIPANKKVVLVYTHPVLKSITAPFQLKQYEILEYNPIMSVEEQLTEVVITGDRRRVEGITSISSDVVRKNPNLTGGIESVIKTLQGVSSNTELSSAYSVRGGNYDENLVYVNEVEVYRPFLVRSGQQEG
jgi:hypothetical protein